MMRAALDKARKRLEKAHECFTRASHAESFAEFESEWSDFLSSANSIYSALEQGSKDNPQSRQWYGGKKTKRRKDPLLNYLHQARNADEHGIEPVTEHNKGHIYIGIGGDNVHIKHLKITQENMVGDILPVEGKYPTIKVVPPHAVLTTVVDSRFGTVFDTPREHLGASLSDQSPLTVGRLGLVYLDGLVEEAEKLVV